MPKKTVGFFAAAVIVLLFTPALATASCDPGYYLNNGVCSACGNGYYCPGGNAARVSCLSLVPAGAPAPDAIYSPVNSDWSDRDHAYKPEQCMCDWFMSDETRIQYQYESQCRNGPGGSQFTKYYWCRVGHYAISPLGWGNWYTNCAPCTNAPANAHYTSYSTPSSSYAVESNCPWECDTGYGRVGRECKPLCAAVVTMLRAGNATAPLFPVKYTTPTLVVRVAGGTCYGNLRPGTGAGINIRVGNTTYRVE